MASTKKQYEFSRCGFRNCSLILQCLCCRYVTPTNYLETVRGYRGLLSEKRSELGDKANKLRGGLQKLDETTVQVAEMKKVRTTEAL